MRRRYVIPTVLSVVLITAACGSDDPGDAVTSPTPSNGSPGGIPCLGEGGPAQPPNSGPDTDVYLGLSEKEATRLAADNGFTARVAGRDGECFALTMDYRTDRVNLYLEDDVVAAATIG